MSDFLPPVVLRLAADISEYTEKLALASAQLEEFTNGAGQRVATATGSIGEEGRRAGEEYSKGLGEHAVEGAERVVRDTTGRLRDSRGRFVKEGEEGGKAVETGLLASLRGALSGIGSAVTALGSAIGNGISSSAKAAGTALSSLSGFAFPALIAAALQAVPALSTVAGALAGSIPAAASVGAGALATLALGFHGLAGAISAVFAPAAAGGGQAMGQLQQAEWSLTQAQQQAKQAQEALNQARVAAVQNIKDLALAMSGAKLSVEEAQLAVKDADLAWRQAFATGNQDQIYRTNLALRQAQQNLAEAQNSADKTAAQKADADARGVEGAQNVQSALQAQANAIHAVEQAQLALAQAMKGSGGAASALATAMAGLAPSARAVVEEIMRLKPALHDIQQTVQQHMFAGLASDLDNLAHAWLPGAKAGLTGLSDQFNLLFRGIAQGLATPAFTGALTTVFSSFTQVFHEFASLAPQGIAAFAHLAEAATPFMRALGDGASGALGSFLGWINKLAANGDLQKFFSTAVQLLTPLGGLLKDVGSIISSVFEAISGSGGGALGVIGELIHQFADFFKTADGAKALGAIFSVIAPILKVLGGVVATLLPPLGHLLGVLGPPLSAAISALGPPLTKMLDALTPVINILSDAVGAILTPLAPLFAQLAGVIADVFVSALQALMPIFTALLPVLVTLVQALLPALVPIIQLVGQVFQALMPIFVPLIKLLVDILVPILKLLTPVIAAIAPVIGWVADALVMVITPIANFIGWLVAGLDKASTWKAIGKWFSDLWDTISNAFMKGVHWVAQKWDEFIDNVKAIPKRTIEAIGDFNSLLLNKGKDLITGLWNGILSMGSWLSKKVMGFVKDFIPGPIANALGIRSPSKVAADLARWVPIGLAQGMDDSAHHVVSASGRLGVAMLSGVNGARPSVAGLPIGSDGAALVAPASGGGDSGSLPPIQLTIPIQIGGQTMQTVHLELIPYAQRYKARNGTTGLS